MAQCEQPQAFPPGFTLGLNVRDLDASKQFYGDVLGMRHIFTIQYTDSFSLTYMGLSQGGKNGTAFQTGEELLRNKNNSGGLIKFLHFSKSATELVVPTEKTTTLSNIGLVVPNLKEAEKWFDGHGVKIVKHGGVESPIGKSAVSISFGVEYEATIEELAKGL
ncbi:VOC family protein [Aspergillus undulatus]|uniref:VOC family protein n=1 Tax=Aspergillus undulatus TaxID=1810928 RepID=UPI003CCE4A85